MTQKTILETYPKETQEAVKDMLGAYRKINVITNNGIHEVSTGFGLTTSYAKEAIELAYIFKKEIEVYNKGTFFVYKIDDERSKYQNRLFLENLMS